MTGLALILGITCVFLIFFLVQETRKSKKLERENDGLRELSLNRETNIEKVIKSGLPVETIASYLASKIQFMIECRASVKSVLDICDDLGITSKVTIPIGVQSDIDKVRTRTQEIISERFDHESIQEWTNFSRMNVAQLDRINGSFFAELKKSMLVMTL